MEARSYSLLVGFLALSAALWLRIEEKRFMAPALALCLNVAVSCHYLAVVALVPFGLAEVTMTLFSRRIRWHVWVALFSALCPFFLGLPLLLNFRNVFGANFWSKPTFAALSSTYDLLGLNSKLALILMFFFGLIAANSLLQRIRGTNEETPSYDLTQPQIILLGGFLYYPVLLVALAWLFNSGYTPRYGWPAILGLVLVPVYLLRTGRFASASNLLVASLAVFAVTHGRDYRTVADLGSIGSDQRWARLATLCREEPDIPVVVGSGITFLDVWHYAPKDLRERLVNVVDTEEAVRLTGSDSVDRANLGLARFVPLRVEDLTLFEERHKRFIFFSGGGLEWLTQYLLEKRYHLRLLSRDSGSSLYMAER